MCVGVSYYFLIGDWPWMILNDWSFDNRLKYYIKKHLNFSHSLRSFLYVISYTYEILVIPILFSSHMFRMFLSRKISSTFHQDLSIGHLYIFVHSSFRPASLSRGQFRLRISARTTTWANRRIWHIVPTDRLNDLINILLHTTFTLRVLFVLSRRMASRTVFISIH